MLDRIATALRSRVLLLVLDNCEHLLGSSASVAETVAHAGAGLRVLATSREPLKVEGEWLYRVPPLTIPAEDETDPEEILNHSAVQLFMSRTMAAEPRSLDCGANVEVVGSICRHLDGIPLAIELAAARAATLGIEALADRLGDRFRLLTDGRRTALPRHQNSPRHGRLELHAPDRFGASGAASFGYIRRQLRPRRRPARSRRRWRTRRRYDGRNWQPRREVASCGRDGRRNHPLSFAGDDASLRTREIERK